MDNLSQRLISSSGNILVEGSVPCLPEAASMQLMVPSHQVRRIVALFETIYVLESTVVVNS